MLFCGIGGGRGIDGIACVRGSEVRDVLFEGSHSVR